MVISFLLKKGTNPTPYSPISYFGKENNPPHATMRIHHSLFYPEVIKNPNNFTTLEYP
jgi:hypothetical protein